MLSINGVKITPTIFPDNTSQVWKLPKEILEYVEESFEPNIKWKFENEAEVFHVIQLIDLLGKLVDCKKNVLLVMDYLPYARQDKEISNESTFALCSFLNILSFYGVKLRVFDPHSLHLLERYFAGRFQAIEPITEIVSAYTRSKSNLVCFPDKGAKTRYAFLHGYEHVIMDKVRDQLTGRIDGLSIDNPELVSGKKILIIDDIADGAYTFVLASRLLKQYEANEVNLYVSHGLFTKGVDILKEAGILRIYTKNGLLHEFQ